MSAPADDRNRIGVFEQASTETASHGPGQGGGAGTGSGTGLGPGDGAGIGPGSGGGTGGGPFRPGSGIEPPRLLREVKADYSEDARRRGLEGEVVMEIVVTRNGSVGDVRILKRLGAGLDERAIAGCAPVAIRARHPQGLAGGCPGGGRRRIQAPVGA